MTRQLEEWAVEVPAGLRRAQSTAARMLRELAERALREVKQRAPGSVAETITLIETDEGAVIASTHPGAAKLEAGGLIRGRPWLAVPLHTYLERLPGPRSDPANLFVLRGKDGRLFLASRASGVLDVRWRLVSSVMLGAHPFFEPGIAAAREGFEEKLVTALDSLVVA